ncbi:MAG TPA: cation-translocating P-type ATPase [Rhabdochlamydiaceae bacterium]|nr:cation-translocating P-type ATPase [Rhabdochlamydiaceae bacterium]
MKYSEPYFFDDFFASGREESISPFLTPSSKKWGVNLSLRSALISAALFAAAFIGTFVLPALTPFFLIGVFFLSGTPALIGTLNDLKKFEINIDLLMTLAAFFSIFIGSPMEGALLLVLFELSGSMEDAISQKTKNALINLKKISPKSAYVIDQEGHLIERSIHEIQIGETLLIKAGEVVPLDGMVISGSSFVNLVHLTGESQPILRQKNDEVAAGAKNLDGALTLVVTKTAQESTLTRIMQLIIQAQASKPALETFIDRFGKCYAPVVICLTGLFAFCLPWVTEMSYWGPSGSIYRALTFLVTASPCALIIATPMAYLSAISSCARKGILLKGGAILDQLVKCKVIAFDKTGTLTTGKLQCTSIAPLMTNSTLSLSHESALGIAAGLEKFALHPISHAILSHAASQKITPLEIEKFNSKAGFGLEGMVNIQNELHTATIGHPDYIEEKIPLSLNAEWQKVKAEICALQNPTTLLLVKDALFLFHFRDEIRPQSEHALFNLKGRLHPVMITGDHSENAKSVAKTLGIEEIYFNMRPEDKLQLIEKLSQRDGGLIMVGDGMNDAPALARSSVGISMGKIGSGAAIDASDIVLLNENLALIPWLAKKADKTLSIVKQNLIFSLLVILCASTTALLGFIPLWLGVVLHEGGTVLVGLNSLRLSKKDH